MRTLAMESLENRQVLSADVASAAAATFDPSALEQEMVEHLNRMRMAPQAELDVLFTDVESATARDPDAALAMTVYQDPSAEEIATDWEALSAVEPLAWNLSLYDAASDHNTLMVQYDEQSHLLPGEQSLGDRLAAAGYEGSAVGENVFAYMNTVFHGHSAFAIDWGVPNRSHRDNLMASTYREVGISIVADDDGDTQVGPYLVTEDFGDGANWDDSYLLGVVWDDLNDNGWYDAGEGLSDVEFLIEGAAGTFTTTGWSAGGYQTFVPDGVYTVTAYGGDLPTPMVVRDVVIADQNVKVDFEYDPYQNLAPVVDLNGPAEAGLDFQTTFYEGSTPIPVASVDGMLTDDDSEELVSLTATITNLREPGEYLVADTTGTSISADYNASLGTLTLSGTASLDDYSQILATLSYGNVTTGPDETTRVISVEASDGTNTSTAAEATVAVIRTTLPELTIDDPVVLENADGAVCQFTVQMSDTMTRTVTVDFSTADGSAMAGDDYEAVQQTLEFAPGETVKTISVALIDDEVPEDEELFYGTLSNADGATITTASDAATIVDDDVAVKLGGIDFLGMEGLDLTEESATYQFTTTRDGVLSVEVTGETESEISLVLYDEYRSAEIVVSVVSVDGVARFDLPDVSADETYYLEVSGTESDADLLMGNVVQKDGQAISVVGTEEDDVFTFEAGDTLLFSFNGLSYSYAWEDAESVAFQGGEGDDQASLTGGAADDTASLLPGSGALSSEDYTVTLAETETIEVAGGEGDNTAKLYDSEGDDRFIASGDAGELSGEGFANSATGFNLILGYATGGGEDTAQLVGTEAYEEFVGKPDYSKIFAEAYYQRAKLFDHVMVTGNGGDDFARMYGNDGAEHFEGGPLYGEMTGEGLHYRVDGYVSVHGYARGRDGDTATLVDSSGDDTLVVVADFAKVLGDGYVTRAKFFPNVEIAGTGEGADSARLYDSEHDDLIVIAETGSSVSRSGCSYALSGFDQVTAYEQEGGEDTVRFEDSAADDTFTAEPGAAILSGNGFLGQAYGFSEVLAYARAGGSDTATFYDSVGDDELYSDPNVSWISGTGYFARAKFFEQVTVYSTSGGYDTARFLAGDSDATFQGTATASTMQEDGVSREAQAFEAVYAEAGSGEDSASFEATGRDDDLFESGENWARLSNDVLGIVIEATDFEAISTDFEDSASAA